MPKQMCQLGLTLDVPTAEWVEEIAKEIDVRPGGCGRILLEQRLALEKAGWKCDNMELGAILEAVVSLDERTRGKLVKLLIERGALSGSGQPVPEVYLVPDSYFRTGVLRSSKG